MQRIVPLILSALMVGGCAADSALTDRTATLQYRGEYATPQDAELAIIRRYHGSNTDRENMSPQEYRDSIVYRQLAADDDSFGAFVRTLRTERASGNIATDVALLTLNGLAAVTGGAQTKATLATISGALVGAKGSVDKELFNLEALSAIISRMQAARLGALVPIKAGLAQSNDDYPLEQALFDLRAYANAGTLSGALTAITNDAGEQAKEASDLIREYTRDATYRDSQAQRGSLSETIGTLPDQQAIHLAFLMQQHIAERSQDLQADLQRRDPTGKRFKDGNAARLFLRFWVVQESGAPDIMKQWVDALELAKKG